MQGTPTHRRSRRTATAVLAGALATIALLLFAWPLARSPRLHVVQGLLHIFAAWVLTVAALWFISRRVRPGEDESSEGELR
jgi:hypothetical protein